MHGAPPCRHFPLAMHGLDEWLTILISLLLVEVLLVVGVAKFIAIVVPSVVASDSGRDGMMVWS